MFIMNDNFQQPMNPQPPQPPFQPPSSPGKGMAIASMVLGIVSLAIPFVGTFTAIVGLVLGALAMKNLKAVGAPTGMAVAGIVCSIIALAISVICIFTCYVPMWCAANEFANELNNLSNLYS